MNRGIFTVGIIGLAVVALVIINLVGNYYSSNELDSSLLRDTIEAAMLEAVDTSTYGTESGVIRMDKEKFVESFIRRFAENVNDDRDYDIRFYDINETPPKATVVIDSKTAATVSGEDIGIVNSISGIIETKYEDQRTAEEVWQESNQLNIEPPQVR